MLADGDVLLATGRLDSSLTRAAFCASPLAVEPSLIGGGAWQSFDLGAQVIGDHTFLITLRFDGERLAIVELFLTQPGDATSWEEASKARELARKKQHDAWLAAQLGPAPWTYPWGTIESTYDPRSGSSGITICYVSGSPVPTG